MAISSCLRRSRVIPLAIRSLGSSIKNLLSVDVPNRSGVQLLPCRRFSTDLVTNAINLTDDIPASSHVVAPIPSDVPFTVHNYLGVGLLYLQRMYQEESISILVGDLNRVDVDHPFIPLKVTICKGNMELSSDIILMPDRIEIWELTMRGGHEEALKEFLETKQIISSEICRHLCDRLGIK